MFYVFIFAKRALSSLGLLNTSDLQILLSEKSYKIKGKNQWYKLTMNKFEIQIEAAFQQEL